MKRLLSALLALSMLTAAVSCGERKGGGSSEPVAVTETELMSYKTADIEMGKDFKSILSTDKRGGFYLIFGETDENKFCGYMTDTKFSEKRSFTYDAQDGEDVKCAAVMTGGKVAVLSVIGSHTYIHTYTKDLEPENSYDLGDVFSSDDRFAQLICADAGFYINVNRYDLGFADKEGNYKGTVNVGGRTVSGITLDKDGLPCALLADGLDNSLAVLDGGNISEEIKCGELSEYTNAICRGEGDHRIAVIVGNGLYGLKENSWVRLSDFSDNDFNTTEIYDMEMTGENEFTIVKWGRNGAEMRLLTQRDVSEIKQKRIIRIAQEDLGYNNDPYDDLMKKYNSQSEDFKVEVVTYSGNYSADCYAQLRLDIIAGNAPDVFFFGEGMPVESFGDEESIFVDMYSLMDNDPDISRSDFLDYYLEGLETNGKLLQINNYFDVETMFIKDKFAKGLTSWTFDRMADIIKNRPEGMEVFVKEKSMERVNILDNLANYTRFYDRQQGKCWFDSPDFIYTMKFIQENNIGADPNMAEYKWSAGAEESILAFHNDEALLNYTSIHSFREIKEYVEVYSGEPITFIGFPNDDGISAVSGIPNGYGIMANSDNIEGAWDFLKFYLFSDDSAHYTTFAFPAIEKYYNMELEEHCSKPDPETGEETNYYNFYTNVPGVASTETLISPFNDEEKAKYDAFIRETLKHQLHGDSVVHNIVYEEVPYYFRGEKTAEQVAEIIQNRVSIYLSEQS